MPLLMNRYMNLDPSCLWLKVGRYILKRLTLSVTPIVTANHDPGTLRDRSVTHTPYEQLYSTNYGPSWRKPSTVSFKEWILIRYVEGSRNTRSYNRSALMGPPSTPHNILNWGMLLKPLSGITRECKQCYYGFLNTLTTYSDTTHPNKWWKRSLTTH